MEGPAWPTRAGLEPTGEDLPPTLATLRATRSRLPWAALARAARRQRAPAGSPHWALWHCSAAAGRENWRNARKPNTLSGEGLSALLGCGTVWVTPVRSLSGKAPALTLCFESDDQDAQPPPLDRRRRGAFACGGVPQASRPGGSGRPGGAAAEGSGRGRAVRLDGQAARRRRPGDPAAG